MRPICSAFNGGLPNDGVVHLSHTYPRTIELPGLTVSLLKGADRQAGDMPMQGKALYFPSEPRLLLENLTQSRGPAKKSAGRKAVEARLLNIADTRGDDVLSGLREAARVLARPLGFNKEFLALDSLIRSILGTRTSKLKTVAGKARTTGAPYDPDRLELIEKLAVELRTNPLGNPLRSRPQTKPVPISLSWSPIFSNFTEGTEFDVQEDRGFVLEGKPSEQRPKDSHDVIGVFRQAVSPAWVNQTLSSGEPVLAQLRARHADQMAERPEVSPGELKVHANRAGNT